ncbi:MAG: leucine-rich repeat protein [Erysipelotrichaceae bacterium]
MWNEFPEGEFFDIDEEGTILAYHGNIYKELKIPTKIRGIRVKAIGSSAFEGKGLIHVKLPVYLECIHERAFAHNLLEDFQAFPSLKQIKSKAFAHNYIFVLPPLEGVEVARDAFVNNDPPSIDAMIAYAMEGDGLRYPEKVEPLPVSLDANMLRH